MRKSNLYIIGLLALLSVAVYSCKKPSNGIDNNNVLETPYALFVSDSGGSLFITNDGTHLRPAIFPADGYPTRAICWSGNNILMVKSNCYYSYDNGVNFNHTYDTVQVPLYGAINQSLILNATDENRLYIAENQFGTTRLGFTYLGIAYSEHNGSPKTWVTDTLYDTSIHSSIHVSSFTQIKKNTLFGYDATSNYLVTRANATANWKHVTPPDNSTLLLPTPSTFTLGHLNNTLVAIDNVSLQGAYYSDDEGQTWLQYAGLPKLNLFAVASPFDQVLLVGTDGDGVYRLEQNTHGFVSSNSGLAANTKVRAIVAKQNYYKNGSIAQYIYLATNTGLYQSVDGGHNWILTYKGNLYSAY